MSAKTSKSNGKYSIKPREHNIQTNFFLSLLPKENTYKLCDKVKEVESEMVPWERR